MAKQKSKPADDSQPADEALPGVPTVAEAATDETAAAETPADDSPRDELAGDEPEPEPELPAADEPAPTEPDADRPQKINLVLALDIALGNGTRSKGHRLGAFCCAIGVTIAEALALAADTQADCIVGEPANVGVYPVVTRGAATVADRDFPPGSHVGNFEIPPESDTLRSEALQALRSYSVVCS